MTYPRIIPDRDKDRKWYLDQDIKVELHNGDILVINKGFRFDGHSLNPAIHIFSFLAAFCVYEQWILLANLFWGFVLLSAYFKYRYVKPQDIFAALVHDYLIDTEPWHRYNRAFMDKEYELQMQKCSYGFRKWIMPKAVYIAGFLRFSMWGDYRGEPKPNTRIEVKVTHDTV